MGRKIKLAQSFSKFVLINAFGTIVDTVVLWAFSTFVFEKYLGDYIIAPLISFECALTANYINSVLFIWKDRVKGRSRKGHLRKYLIYNASCSAVFLTKMVILLLIESVTGWNVVFCNLAALCISGILNFCLSEWLIFKKRKIESYASDKPE